jgi:hypothetical protein
MSYLFARRTKSSLWSKLATVAVLALLSSAFIPIQVQYAAAINSYYDCSTGGPAGAGPKYFISTEGEVSEGGDCTGHVEISSDALVIGFDAFKFSAIESVNIPSTVTEIGDCAFCGTGNLTSVSFSPGSSLDSIEEDAFYASSLTSITIPSSVTFIGNYAFEEARDLETVTFAPGSQLETIGTSAFSNTDSLTSISIPSGVTEINYGTFWNAGSLTAVTIPGGVISIGDYAFSGTDSLTAISLPSSLTSIGENAFNGAIALTTISIPSSVTSIGQSAFWGATSLKSFYFLGDAPADTGNAFFVENNPDAALYSPDYAVAPFAKAFIQPSAVGFQQDPAEAGYGVGKIEMYWKGLIVRTAPNYVSSELYRSWGSSLTSINNGPKVGDTLYASAFERELSRSLYLNDFDGNGYNFQSVKDEYEHYIYPAEEYVYRITTLPNAPTSSVDRQSAVGYESLTSTEQEDWYTDMGFNHSTSYEFSWRAFMCVLDSDGSVDPIPPTHLTLSYASREDGPTGADENPTSFMFRDASADLLLNRSPSTRTVVGTSYSGAGGFGLVGGVDVYNNAAHSLGILQVNSSCGVGKSLQALRIVDTDTNLRIDTKEFVVQDELRLELQSGEYYDVVDPVGVTVGVTGAASVTFNAALWGLTTIASANAPTGDTGPGPSANSNGPIVKPTSDTRSTVFSGFAGNSSKAPASMRQGLTKLVSGFKKVDRVECTGYTSGTVPNRWTSLLARNRAKVACNLVKKEFPNAVVQLRVKPATGVGSVFRRVQVKVVGS